MRKFLSLFTACCLAGTMLTGCGTGTTNNDNGGATSATSNGTTSVQETNISQTAVQNTVANADGIFTIGGIGPITGSAAAYGLSVKQAAEIAIKEINTAGGVKVGDKTYQLALEFADDEAKADKAVTAYNYLMDKNVNAILGAVTTDSCNAVKSLSYADGILQITPSASGANCVEYDNAFRLCFTDPLQGKTMGDVATKDLGYKKIAVIYNSSNDYSTGVKETFVETVKANGAEIVAEEAFNEGDVDFSTQLTSIKASGADAIFASVYYSEAAYITQQANDAGMKLPFLGSDGWDGILDKVTNPAIVEGAIFLSPFIATDPSAASFVNAYKADYNATPDQFAADGYDTVYVIKAAMEKAGSIESADLISAMTQISVNGVTGNVSFSADGEPNKTAKLVEIKNGQYTARQ